MTDENQVEDQDVELHDEENEVVEGTHDPKNAEAQSVDSVDKAGEATGTAKKRKGDKGNKDPMQKAPTTKAGMINAAFQKMNGMSKTEMADFYGKMFSEGFDEGDEAKVVAEVPEINYEADFSQDQIGRAHV